MSVTTTALLRATPESVGISSQAVRELLSSFASGGPGQEMHSLMVLRHGRVVAEGWWRPYEADRKHLLYSLSKSFTSTAVGFAVSENLFGLDDAVISFFPGDVPADISTNLAALRVRHLLTMTVGQATEPWPNLDRTKAKNWVSGFLAHPIDFEPGSQFLYNSIATFMLAAIVEKTSGQALLDYLKPRLLDPLGIHEATWDLNPEGITVGGWGLSVYTESIAKFGQLYLQDGVWEGKRILPEGWVKEATSKQTDNGSNPNDDWQSGYCYQFWRCKSGCYRADGAFGQFAIVNEAKDMVVVGTACVDFMHETFDSVYAFMAKAQDGPIPGDPSEEAELAKTLGGLCLDGPIGEGFSHSEAMVTGRTYAIEGGDIESLRWAFSAEGCELTILSKGETHVVKAHRKAWLHGTTSFEETRHQPVAASGVWLASGAYKLTLQYLEEPASTSFTTEFHGDRVKVMVARRGRFIDKPLVTLEGLAKK